MRLRGQYTLVIGSLVCSSLIVLGSALLAEQRRYAHDIGALAAKSLDDSLRRQIEKHGVSVASALATRMVSPLYHNDFRTIVREATEQQGYPDIVSIIVVDAKGVAIREGGQTDRVADNLSALPWVRSALSSNQPVSTREGSLLRIAAPVVVSGHTLGAVILEISADGVADDILSEQTRLNRLITSQSTSFSLTGFALGIILVTISILAAVGVAGGLSRPVVAFAARARRIGRGELVYSEGAPSNDEIGDLSQAFDELTAALKSTTVSKDYFDNVIQSMADMLLVVDSRGTVLTANSSCLAELGWRETELRGKSLGTLLPYLDPASEAATNPASSQAWYALRRSDRSEIPVRVAISPLRSPDGAFIGHVLVMQNVAKALAAEQQAERSLAEKEILLREIHHRVKNNLQIISSMLSLQGNRSSDEQTREVFQESEARIRAMALVHEQLYRSDDLAHVDLSVYLDTLAQKVLRYFGRPDCSVSVKVDESVREVTVDRAIPIGLIVNELITNSVQHGIGQSRAGSILVRFTTVGQGSELSVLDDGAGMPAGLDIANSDSLGLKLVVALTEQLGGSFSISSHQGTRCVVSLPRGDATAASSQQTPTEQYQPLDHQSEAETT